ncbi:YybH family protein [Luteimonas salinilitoris]|uniref:Nuclear transport factor 2 family protein n=1 Tax=Luteimonas salinilitoris TaxID=3237697 RepID=A0ABV4HRF8_9GAMM
MKSIATFLILILAMVGVSAASAQSQPDATSHAHHPAAADQPQMDVPAETETAVAVAERFSDALSKGDLKTVEELLAPDVLILESGGAERSREEYLGHHAISDAKFLKGTHRQLLRRRARTAGDLVWIGSESELHAEKDGKPLVLLSTETMVLRQTPDGWRIAHIHWSSRPKR